MLPSAFLRLSICLVGVAVFTVPACSKASATKTYVSAAFGATHFPDLGQLSSSLELLGGVAVLPHFFLEASYLDLGETLPQEGAYTVNVSGFNFAGKATLPISSRMDFFAKMGLYVWEAKEDFGDVRYSLQAGEDMTYGGGLAWRSERQLDLSLEYKELLMADATNQQLSLGVTYSF